MSDETTTDSAPEAPRGPARYVYTDYWNADDTHRPYRGMLRDPVTDAHVQQITGVMDLAVADAGVRDGDEIELRVVPTGRRPFGDRRVRWVAPHTYARDEAAGPETGATLPPDPAVRIRYTNHRGETAWRRVRPVRVWYGATAWHPQRHQWPLDAHDLDRPNEPLRSFALRDVHEWAHDDEQPTNAAAGPITKGPTE